MNQAPTEEINPFCVCIWFFLCRGLIYQILCYKLFIVTRSQKSKFSPIIKKDAQSFFIRCIPCRLLVNNKDNPAVVFE